MSRSPLPWMLMPRPLGRPPQQIVGPSAFYDPWHSALLTVSGNEITDATRLAKVEGDGLTYPDGTFGIWGAATNRNLNGNASTNTIGVTDSGATTTRVTTGVHKFGSTHFNEVTANLAANEGAYEAISGGAASTQYTASVWVWAAAGSPTVRIVIYDDVSGKQASAAVTLTTMPQRISKTATTGALSSVFRTYIETDVQQAATFQWGGLQTETGSIATPYKNTDGGTATRAASRVQVPVAGIANSRQMWFACRVRFNWASTGPPISAPRFFSWGDAVDNYFEGYINALQGLVNDAYGGAAVQSVTLAGAFLAGAVHNVLWSVETSNLKISRNGAALTASGNRAEVPVIIATTLDIGSLGTLEAGDQAYADFFWWATGLGTVTNTEAAILGALPNVIDRGLFPQVMELSAYGNGGEFPTYWTRGP